MSCVLGRLVVEENGQDLLEYALLAGLVALVTIPALSAIQQGLKQTYISWNAAMLACWQMPAPGVHGGC